MWFSRLESNSDAAQQKRASGCAGFGGFVTAGCRLGFRSAVAVSADRAPDARPPRNMGTLKPGANACRAKHPGVGFSSSSSSRRITTPTAMWCSGCARPCRRTRSPPSTASRCGAAERERARSRPPDRRHRHRRDQYAGEAPRPRQAHRAERRLGPRRPGRRAIERIPARARHRPRLPRRKACR